MKIGIVGSGMVGATAAYALIMRGIGREIVLVDLNANRAQAEADDLFHAVPFAHPLAVSGGSDYHALHGAEVVIIAAGVAQKPGETRLELLGRNAAVFRAIIPQVLANAPEAIIVVATNPVDVMTHMAAYYAAEFGVPSSRVLGSGTTLDTARFRALLGRHLNVDPQHVHGYVLGEHGDSEVMTWSRVTVGGIPLKEFIGERGLSLSGAKQAEIDGQVRNAAYNIINGKGATYYGIGSALAKIVQAILGDQRAILTVCTPMDEIAGVKDVTVSLPHLVGGEGILDSYPLPLHLNDTEQKELNISASVVRKAIEGVLAIEAGRAKAAA